MKLEEGYSSSIGFLTTLTNLLVGAVTIANCIFAINFGGSSHFKNHIVLCVVGYTLMMSQGIMSLAKQNSLTSSMNWYAKNITHRIIGVIGSSLAIAGSIIRISGVNSHLISMHGIFGWIALVLTCLTFLGGLFSLYVDCKRQFRIIHAILGSLTFICAMISLCYGMDKTLFRNWISDFSAEVLIIFVAFIIVGVCFPALKTTSDKIFKKA